MCLFFIYSFYSIENVRVKVKPLVKMACVVRCHHCHLFGHTKIYCKQNRASVKCILNHLTKDCKKNLIVLTHCWQALPTDTGKTKQKAEHRK